VSLPTTPLDLFTPQVAAVAPADFDGVYQLVHDGWPGVLTLHDGGSRIVRGKYYDSRFAQEFAVTGRVDTTIRHRIELTIHKFNWVPQQRFVGYMFTGSRDGFAGETYWQDIPFGFLARRGDPLPQETYRPGDVETRDFGGRYRLYHDGREGTIELEVVQGRELRGTYRSELLAGALAVRAEVDSSVLHRVRMVLVDEAGEPSDVAILNGYLFQRPKNAIAGWGERNGARIGFYMTRRS
jgi:hypothetical protein